MYLVSVVNKHSSTCTQLFFTVFNTFSLMMADADAAGDTPKVQLPPFTPPKFHWNQTIYTKSSDHLRELLNLPSKANMRNVPIM